MWRFKFFLWVDLSTKEPSHKPCGVSSFFCESTFAPKNLPMKPCGVSSFFCESTFAPKNLPTNHVAFHVLWVSRPSHQRTFPPTMWRFKFFLWVDLSTKEPSHKPCGVSSFFCESTFAPKNLPTNHVAFHVLWVSRPSHQRAFPQTMWRFKFFLWVDLRTKEPSHQPCGVSSFFCGSTFAPKNLPTNHVAFQVFFVSRPSHQRTFPQTMWRFTFCEWVDLRTKEPSHKPCGVSSFFCESTFAPKNLPTNHVAFQVFFVSRPSHQRTFPQTMWRFKFFLWVDLRTKEPSHNDVAFQVFFVSRPSHQRTFPETMWRFKFLLWVDLRTKEPSHKPCGVSIFFVSRPSHQRAFPQTMWRFMYCLWVDLRTKEPSHKPCGVSSFFCESTFAPNNLPTNHVAFQRTKEPAHKPCGVSSFFCESTFAPKNLPTNHVAFQVYFVSRPSHQRTFPQTMWRFKFFLWVDLRTKEPSHKPCCVSSFFLWVDLRTKEPSHKPCGVSSFFCESTFAPKNLPTNHVAVQVVFVSRPSHQRIFP